MLILLIFITLLLSWMIKKYVFKFNHHGHKNNPPSPPKLPVIGNLHQLSALTHRALQTLGAKHGPVMLLHFGSKPVLVIQSADAAAQFLKEHDLVFSDKPHTSSTRRLLYDLKDMIITPYGEYWRKLKSICVLQLLSNKRVQSYKFIREEETALLLEEIKSCCLSETAVDLSQQFDLHSNNVICRASFGRRFGEGENGRRFTMALRELFRLMATMEIGEFVPWLSWISRVNGFYGRVEKVREELDEFLEMVVEEHLSRGLESGDGNKNNENFVDILLKDSSIDRDGIKGILLDMLAGGTDTTSSTLEWAMTELIRNPTFKMKLQAEVREIVQDRQVITDDDLGKMQYLKAVIKETLRLHAPVSLLGRVTREDITVMGYDISANTLVLVNIWAIGRDPASWDQPEMFHPERFLNSSLDFKGVDFKFAPFGHGRRGCPGTTLAIASVELVLANLVHKFEWKLPMGAKCEDLDVLEQPGVSLHRKNALLVVPIHREHNML
ncbi:cytochrome P450 736A117-like [Salvia splendens]|uniref:cytochrome P450 736A117-like n=1 Tax=Salvia splendens TaxID=180675 RepID=UPI001C257B98|nr:cytochrome P450 736A117-like [Salvia splendens]